MKEYHNNSFGYKNKNINRNMKQSVLTVFCFRDSNGLSLVSTLWILTILSVLAMQLLYSFQLENNAQRNFVDRVKYHYAAKAGFEWGIAKLGMDETNFDSLGETWAEPVQHQIDDGIQAGRFLTYQVAIIDEASKININTVDANLIRNLLAFLGAQPENNETGDLADRIVEARPYRTVRDVAKVEGMTPEILYGLQQQAVAEPAPGEPESILPQTPSLTTTSIGGLVNMATVYSVDANTDANGQQRVNINTANAQQLTQIRGNNNQSVFSQAEANAVIQQRDFTGFSALLDVPAISDQVFNNIRSRITVEDKAPENNDDEENQNGNGNEGFGDRNGGGNGGGNNQDTGNDLININTADSDELEELQGIDKGIADRIIAHRDAQGSFQNTNAIKDVRVLTVQEFAGIVDKISIKDGQTVEGLININTAPLEILQLLPGMDQQKAQAIITWREQENPDAQDNTENPVRGTPFNNLSELLQVEGIDTQSFRQVVDWVTYRSHGYRIESAAVDLNGKIIATCLGIVVRNNNQLTVPYWRQD